MASSTPVHSDRRGHAREPVMLAGSAYGILRSRSVGISDLSSEGAQLDGRDLPTTGEDLAVVAGPLDIMARVVWRTDCKCGIRFDEPVPQEMIEQMKRDARWASVAGWYR